LASLPESLFGTASRASVLFWDPAHRRIAAWQMPDMPILTLNPVQVHALDYGTGEVRAYELDWADTVARLRAQS
ncbi:MAG TPA: hypothetical protein VKF62_04175, partial [Planctomycetota bacterium]|nr:hypothetical protein [Planctomycetota bacterium]